MKMLYCFNCGKPRNMKLLKYEKFIIPKREIHRTYCCRKCDALQVKVSYYGKKGHAGESNESK